jgi:hypothetical protein
VTWNCDVGLKEKKKKNHNKKYESIHCPGLILIQLVSYKTLSFNMGLQSQRFPSRVSLQVESPIMHQRGHAERRNWFI